MVNEIPVRPEPSGMGPFPVAYPIRERLLGTRSGSLFYALRRRASSAGPPMTVAPWTLGEPAEGKPPMGTLTRPAVTGPTQSAYAMSTPEDGVGDRVH